MNSFSQLVHRIIPSVFIIFANFSVSAQTNSIIEYSGNKRVYASNHQHNNERYSINSISFTDSLFVNDEFIRFDLRGEYLSLFDLSNQTSNELIFEDAAHLQIGGVKITTNNRIFIALSFLGSLSFADTIFNSGSFSIALLEFNNQLELVNHNILKQSSGAQVVLENCALNAREDKIAINGWFTPELNIGNKKFMRQGSELSNSFTAEFDLDSFEPLFVDAQKSRVYSLSPALDYDPLGNLYSTSMFFDTLKLTNGQQIENSSFYRAVSLIKYDLNREISWITTLRHAENHEMVFKLKVNNNLLKLSGTLFDNVDIEGEKVYCNGIYCGMLYEFDPNNGVFKNHTKYSSSYFAVTEDFFHSETAQVDVVHYNELVERKNIYRDICPTNGCAAILKYEEGLLQDTARFYADSISIKEFTPGKTHYSFIAEAKGSITKNGKSFVNRNDDNNYFLIHHESYPVHVENLSSDFKVKVFYKNHKWILKNLSDHQRNLVVYDVSGILISEIYLDPLESVNLNHHVNRKGVFILRDQETNSSFSKKLVFH